MGSVAQILPAVAVGVAGDGMKVDLAPGSVPKHALGRQPRLDLGSVEKSTPPQGCPRARKVVAVDHDVQIAVGPRLAAQQRVDAPASVQPKRHPRAFQNFKELGDVVGGHQLSRWEWLNTGG
jgi:hypothetical protein